MMTDPPTDDTEAREPDAPDPTDAKHHAPLHGHTGAVPSDKEALSDTRGRSWTNLVQTKPRRGCGYEQMADPGAIPRRTRTSRGLSESGKVRFK
eukprot:scaffold9171_cov119-Isochrysis_galbana.AAC.1